MNPKTLCNMCLKSVEHLQLHNKELVVANQAEVIHTTYKCGLPAEASSYCQQPVQVQSPRNEQGTRRGRGRGAAAASGHVQNAETLLQRMG